MSAAGGPGGDAGVLNYTALVPVTYNGSTPTGGDSLVENLNVHYQVGASTLGMMETTRLISLLAVRRYRVDAHIDCAGAAHDSWCGV